MRRGFPGTFRRFSQWVSWLAFALALAHVPAASFMPAQSTVVLLSGLPGDMETESAYREHLRTWLEVLAANGQARKVIVLCDDPGSVEVTPLPGEKESSLISVLHADRTNFAGLGTKLQGATNSLVVIAWGHGGRQGNEPVFHVRGPRITTGDFKALGQKMGLAESRWILQFRGSGAFASGLAGEGRQILSSECESAFMSDPVGMSVLARIARGKPLISFEELAGEFGRGTAAWYAERNLARTEEPTLWAGEEKPRLLAPASEEHALASAKSDETVKAGKGGAEAAPTGQLPRDLPPVWQEIKRLDAKSYPDADAVVLRRRISYTLGSNPAVASEQDEFIQILTAEGKRFGDFDVSFSPPSETITFLDTEVLGPDGKLAHLDPESIRETQNESPGDYRAGRRKFFSLPGIVPGAVIHVRYRTEWKTFPLPHTSLTVPIAVDLPAAEAAIEVSVPKDCAFHFALDFGLRDSRLTSSEPAIKQSSYATTYSWRFENLPARQHEALAPPRSHSELLISTFPDWTEFADWYGRLIRLTDEVTPEITAKANELTKDAKNDREKVLALFSYVTRLRYVAIPLGVNSYRPHAAARVLQNQFGDCKDKANFLNAMLRSQKIEACLVLVPRFGQAREDIPGLSFNHAISRVMLGGERLWLDTTDDLCRFGMLPPGDPGRKVLVIDGQTTNLTQLPVPEPKEHVLKVRGSLDYSHLREAVAVTLTATATGYPDYELREVAREVAEHHGSVPLMEARYRPVAGAFALNQQKWSSIAALEDDFSWEGDGEFVGLVSSLNLDQGVGVRVEASSPSSQGEGETSAARTESGASLEHRGTDSSRFALRAPFWLPKEWDVALHRRKGALFLNQGYPLKLDQEFGFALPPNSFSTVLPEPMENKSAPLRWRLEWAKMADARLAARLNIELAQGELSSEDTFKFQKQVRDLLSALAQQVVVR